MTKNQITYLLVLLTLAALWPIFNASFISALNHPHSPGCFRLF